MDLLEEDRYSKVEYLIAVDTDMCYPWEVDKFEKVRALMA